MMGRISDIATGAPCQYCGVGVGDPCQTISGKRATYMHEDRMAPIRHAYFMGLEDGESWTLDTFVDHRAGFDRLLARHLEKRLVDE